MIHKFLVMNLWQEKESYFLCPSSEKGKYRILLCCCLYVGGRWVHQQFLFIFFAEDYKILKWNLVRTTRSSSVLSTNEQILIEGCHSHVEKSNYFFPFIITAKVEQIEITCTDVSRKMCVFYANYNLKTFDNLHVILDRLMHFVRYW